MSALFLCLPNFADAILCPMLSFDDEPGVSSMTLQFDGGYRRTRRSRRCNNACARPHDS